MVVSMELLVKKGLLQMSCILNNQRVEQQLSICDCLEQVTRRLLKDLDEFFVMASHVFYNRTKNLQYFCICVYFVKVFMSFLLLLSTALRLKWCKGLAFFVYFADPL